MDYFLDGLGAYRNLISGINRIPDVTERPGFTSAVDCERILLAIRSQDELGNHMFLSHARAIDVVVPNDACGNLVSPTELKTKKLTHEFACSIREAGRGWLFENNRNSLRRRNLQ